MRKLIVAALLGATLVSGVATAQPPELRRNREDIRDARRDVREAQVYGDRRDVRDAREDLRDARREDRQDRRDYRSDRADYRGDRADWRDYRRDNRGVYRQPAYAGPVRGWRYRPIAVGHRFQPAYYGQRYWVANPGRYRLPVAGVNQRWVRYGDDVALVNVRNGRVTQLYNGFFWR